jgi:hypothetical protein
MEPISSRSVPDVADISGVNIRTINKNKDRLSSKIYETDIKIQIKGGGEI